VRDNVKVFVSAFADTFDVRQPIYEFGSFQIGPEGYADLRPFFPGMTYVGCDMTRGPGVDRIEQLDRLSIPEKTVGTVICMDTLEHVFPLFNAFDELRRVLNDDGAMVISSVMDFWIHSHPHDYWRFTPEAFEGLLAAYPLKVVGFQGLPSFPHTVWAVAFKRHTSHLEKRCRVFCETVDERLRTLQAATQQARSLNDKFKVARKRLSYKMFGPKSEYNKIVCEFKTQWKIINPDEDSSGRGWLRP